MTNSMKMRLTCVCVMKTIATQSTESVTILGLVCTHARAIPAGMEMAPRVSILTSVPALLV